MFSLRDRTIEGGRQECCFRLPLTMTASPLNASVTSLLLDALIRFLPTVVLDELKKRAAEEMGSAAVLLPLLPQTKDLSLVGLEYNMTVSALNTCNCPMLQVRMQHSRSSIFLFISRS